MKNKDTVSSFTPEQNTAIASFLEVNCVGEVCVSRPEVFNGLESAVLAELEVGRFCILLSTALKEGAFPGFTTRKGRSGGIHRVGAFAARDASKGANKTKTPVEVDGNLVHANLKAKVITKYLTEVLGGKESEVGNVKIENTAYDCSDTDAFSKYLSAMAGAVSVNSTAV